VNKTFKTIPIQNQIHTPLRSQKQQNKLTANASGFKNQQPMEFLIKKKTCDFLG